MRGKDFSSPAIWATKISAHFGDINVAQMSRQICSHTPSALNAGAKQSGATCHMTMPQCCYLAKGVKQPSHTTNTIKFDRIPFDPCNSIKRFNLCPSDLKNLTCLQPPGDALMLLLGEGSEATEPYNKYADLFKCMLFDQFDQPIWSTLLSPM